MREGNTQDIQAVAYRSADHLQAAVSIVFPADRNLSNSIRGFSSEIQHFKIEHVSVDILFAEKIESDVSLKELEPALRVFNVIQAENCMHEYFNSS